MNSDDLQQIVAAAVLEALQPYVNNLQDADDKETEQDFDSLGRRISRGYRQRKDVRAGGDRYNDREDACICDLRRQGWLFQDIGEILGRTEGAIERRYKIVKENY